MLHYRVVSNRKICYHDFAAVFSVTERRADRGEQMNLVLDQKAIDEVIAVLEIEYQIIETVSVPGLIFHHMSSKEFYVECNHHAKEKECFVVSISDEAVWELDKFLNPIAYNKEKIVLEHQTIPGDIYMYVKRNCVMHSGSVCLEDIKRNKDAKLQLNMSDLYLLIPGKLGKEDGVWDGVPDVKNDFFECFKTNIDQCVQEEYNSDFAKCLERKCISDVLLKVYDIRDHLEYTQKAIAGIVKHETGFCVIEMMVPNCCIGGNKLLNYYCGNRLKIVFDGEEYSIKEFCQRINVRLFGKKRSMAFVCSDVEKEEIVNALANEEFPMGKIGGAFLEKVEKQNIAQYDTAEVFVSHETMLEKCKTIDNICENRLAYHAIEIFFVELILFQDAAVDKVYCDLNREEEQQRGYRDVKLATEEYEQLSFDMAQAIRFGDYEQFNFPTTRESAKNVAKYFGLEYIFEKYETNRELLGAMISANKRRMQERQDDVKNQFLLLISALATVGTLGDIVYVIYTDEKGGLFSYVISVLLVAGGYGIYKIFHWISQGIYKSLLRRGRKK